MVAIVTGAGLGLDNSSEKVFGAVGQGGGVLGSSAFNRFGENVTVNAATGNLMIDRTDEVLIGRGPDEIVSRGYNSQSMNMGYGAWHDWQFGDARCIAPVTGTVNQAGSSVTRIDSDGSNLVYNYDTGSGTYICSTGGNGEYRLSYNTSTQIWTWTDSKNNLTETYDAAHNGRILLATDNSGNALSFSYDGVTGLLTKATTANGETTTYNYTANNQVKSITTKKADNSTLIRVRYAYDSSFRLSTVTTDLTPNDSSVTDGIKVVTTYTYDGTSDRVAKITQTGGGELDITYTQLGSGAYAVATVKEIVTTGTNATSRTTSFQYNTGNTVITDPNGNTTTLTFDGNNQLTGVTYPTDSSGTRPSYVYTYNGTGDLKSVTDPYSNLTKYAYDPNDNLSKITDTFGNTTTFTYDANNHVLTKTYAAGNGQSGPTVTLSYAYDSSENLRYFVDGDNEVTEYRYNGYGQRTAKILYSDNPYTGGTITESALTTWVNSIANKSTSIRRTDYTYDLRGNPATATSYALCTADATGAGVTTNSPYTQVIYVYDQAGNLLQRQTVGQGTNIETFAYDGLNRIIQSQDLNGGISTVSWSDATNSCSVTMANGLVRVSNYDDSGHLVSVIQNGDTTSYKYDTLGQLGIVSDSQAGTSSYALFDNLGRKTADILADGSLTEYRYDLNGRLVASIVHANKLTSTQLTQLVGSNGNPTNVALSSVLPLPDPGDVWNWRIYDADGRLVETIDGDGGVTSMTYDDMSNLTSTTVYYNVLSSSTLSGFKTTLPNAVTLPTVSAAHDDTTSYYYDSEGRQIGVLNGDGFLTETVYNDAGEKIRTVAHSIAVASSHRGDAFSAIVGLASGTGDLKARYFYDDRGLLTIALDPMLRATKYVYDNANRVTQTILYNGTVGTQQNESAYTLSYVQSQLSSLSGDSANRVSWNVYKTDTGKLDYTIDAAGTVTGFTYDNMGEVTQKSVYATQRTTTMPPLQSDMDSWAATYGSGATDRKTRYVYDTLGNLRFTIDPEHYVVENRYDGSGRLNLTIQYTSTYTPNSIPQLSDMVAWAGGTIPSDAVQTTFSYDADWRLTDTVRDGTGLAVDTRTAYDAQGRVQKVTDAYGSGDDSATYYSYDSAGRLKTVTRGFGTSAASTTQYAYDGQGNILTETDGNNNVTTYTYDVAGQMLTKTDALNNVTSYTYDSFGNVLTTTDPLTHVIYSFYDALNRQILQLDQLGYGTATTYTIGGAVASVTRYATPYNGTITPGVPPTLTTSAQDATTTFTRDKLDRATQVTDAEGFYEKYDLDAFGDRIHIFAKSAAAGPQNGPGGETIDTYDRRGQILTETLPEASYDSSGNQLAATVTNTYSYDSRGNLTQKVEASGLPEHRTTNYTYDKLNRLTLKTEDSFLTLNSDLSAGGRVTPTWTYQYDKRGNVIKTTDPINAVTQTYYDALNRKVAQVDALGDYTQWSYDANSNMLTATSYATAFGTMPAAGGAAPSPLSPSQSRQISYGYDAINRLTSTTVANLLTGSYNGTSYTTATTNVTTTNVYNKTANSLQQIDGNGNSTWSWYDYLGRKIAEVDRDKYITLYTLDSNGNATQETRYVNAYVGSITGSTTYSSIQGYAGAHADNTNDRTTTFLYDRNGQRKQETRLNVAAWTVNADGTLTAAPTSSTINYTYNGLGEVLSKQEATGDTTTYTYDAAGRQIAVDLSSFASGGVTMQLHTLEDYDGLGDLTYTSAYDQLAGTRVYHNTSYTYGGDGILSSMIDANGFERDYSYDADKHLILTNYSRLHSDGTSTTEGDFANYDALGRAIAQGTATKSGGVWGKNDTEQTAYNAYGDVVSKSVNGVVQQTFAYDNGGRMWESTDEGVYTVNLYDKDGNQTLSVTSDGNALASGSWSGFASANDVVTAMGTIGVTQPQGMVETITVYDARSQATSSRLPSRQLSANYYNSNDTEDIITYRTYNAFGEVLTEKDGNAHTTTYTYNTLGKVTSQALPSTTVYDEHNNSSSTNPTQLDYYDLSGRLVGTRDANGNLNTRWLLANTGYGGSDAQAIEEFHADGGKPVNTYDVFGDLTEATNEVGAKTDYTYDGQGQVLTETHPLGAGGQRLVDTYTYDGLGQRLTH
ncbi:MAG: RHS repeat protein [Alphaproteobacteria bacterium]|nr:RHS repeat protein [Alphaproteobacteria bacterium]